MRSRLAALVVLLVATPALADEEKPWCAPEVNELSDHVCYADGGTSPDKDRGKKTLVIYLHGAYSPKPGFAYLQQRAMAMHAKKLGFTVLLPTSPSDGVGFVWPTSVEARRKEEAKVLAGIAKARKDLEKKLGHGFDETFVVGFSSGAYYGSSLAVRGALDADGFMVLAGGTPNVSEAGSKRAPVFVGVSGADKQTASHSRALGGALSSIHWPVKVEERRVGHLVDWTFMEHGIAWLREQKDQKDQKERQAKK